LGEIRPDPFPQGRNPMSEVISEKECELKFVEQGYDSPEAAELCADLDEGQPKEQENPGLNPSRKTRRDEPSARR